MQVNICQKHLFLHQLTHNMTKDCSLNYKFSTWKFQAQNMLRTCCVHKLFFVLTFRTIYVHNMFSTCSELAIFMYWTRNSMNNLVILWVSWCKNKFFWNHWTWGKYLSEALILASTNPQYDDRLFIELRVHYMKIASSEHAQNMLFWMSKTISEHYTFSSCTELGLFIYWSCNSMNNLSSYCG